LYETNFGSNNVAVYDIDIGRVVASFAVGNRPDGIALSQNEAYVLVLNSDSGDMAVLQKKTPTRKDPGEYSLLLMVQVGLQPNNIVVKSFMESKLQ
jgi:DNA-binding beta-propeller fold protein YncE